MNGIFVNDDTVLFSELIVNGQKKAETRNKNMLKSLVGQKVAIISTRSHKVPLIVGYVTIDSASFVESKLISLYKDLAFIDPSSKYFNEKGKWFYFLSNPQKCLPYILPKNAIYHGRSYCSFEPILRR